MVKDKATTADLFTGLAHLVRQELGKSWVQTNKKYLENKEKQVYYFTIEFLLGRLLDVYMLCLGVRNIWKEGLSELGIDYDALEKEEQDAALGNGGLGRLAACFLDSMAAMGLPGHGNGIRYKYGMFEQKVINGEQVEQADNWLKNGNVWEFRKIEKVVKVPFGDAMGTVLAVPYDIPIPGYGNDTVNTLRLWSAEALETGFDLSSFNKGDYTKAIEYKYSVEAISGILYPDDSNYEGRLLRLRQQYFFVSAGLQSIIRFHKRCYGSVRTLADKAAIHINDTHPAFAVPELMRLLMDEEALDWQTAWQITTNTISYTNHTIMPEALEKWPMEMIQNMVPRIFEIIKEINEHFCKELWQQYPGEWEHIAAMAIIANGYVKMAHLAVAGSHSVNGVAKIHTEILKNDVMKLFYQLTPHKFCNCTNGITPRRWLLKANPELASLITDTIDTGWTSNITDLNRLMEYSREQEFQQRLSQVKRRKKEALAAFIRGKYNINLNLESIFDVQVKRVHVYKRQLLNVLRIMDLYVQLKENPNLDIVPRTCIFSGKAAPGYLLAKKIIKLINVVVRMINEDTNLQDKLKVVFIENYGVSLAEIIIPAADVSEQISTASKEASGTSNMKFMMNGAITLGTLDGANIEIREAVGDENIFIFGLTAEDVLTKYRHQTANPKGMYESNAQIRRVVDMLVDGSLPAEREEFRMLFEHLLYGDGAFFELEDFPAYLEAQQRVDKAFRKPKLWWQMSAANIAHSGLFSSDHTVMEYAASIWNLRPVLK
ncbi:MAG: glycogen/starch/alpha-glucan phosphorylase [Firmicutes bacterium]|nr:glycogen/starch/alpha-glucan phosphorylase [Bacillota bacterium]